MAITPEINDEARSLVAQDPERALNLFFALSTAISQRAVFPRLIVKQADEEGLCIDCPHCGAECGGPGTDESLIMMDQTYRDTHAEGFDPEKRTVSFYYDGTSDYDSLTYLCPSCGRPVSLPEGWEEV